MKKTNAYRLLSGCMVMALVIATLLGACDRGGEGPGGDGSSGDTSGDQPREAVHLTLVNWEGEAMNNVVRESLAAFAEDKPFSVELVAAPIGDYKTSLNGMILADEAPDIYQSGHDWAMQFYDFGLTYDWSDYAEQDTAFTDGFYPGSYELWQSEDGGQVGFPNFVNVYGIWYNLDLLKAAGLDAPKEGWTYDDLFEMARTLADPAAGKYGLYGFLLDAFNISTMTVADGGQPFLDDFTNPTAVQTDEIFASKVEQLRGLIQDKVIPATSYELENIESQFTDGNIAMLYYGQWLISDLLSTDVDFEYGYAPNPQGSAGKQVSIFDPVGFCSPKEIEHPDETWELMKFVVGDMNKEVLPETPVAACAYEDASDAFFDTIADKGHADVSDAVQTMMEAETYMPVRFLTTWSSDAMKIWDPKFKPIIDGEVDMSELETVVDKLNSFIEKEP